MSKTAYLFSSGTREYLCPLEVIQCEDGSYPLPENAVWAVPPETVLFEKAVLTSTGKWKTVADYRGVMLYDTATARPVANTLGLGDKLPKTLTPSTPIAFAAQDCRCNQWDAVAKIWRTAPDYSGVILWDKMTGSIAEPLAPGQAIPATLTRIAPPSNRKGQVQFLDTQNDWICVIVEEHSDEKASDVV